MIVSASRLVEGKYRDGRTEIGRVVTVNGDDYWCPLSLEKDGQIPDFNDLVQPGEITHWRDTVEPTFFEFRKDGWPLCPKCGEDEIATYDEKRLDPDGISLARNAHLDGMHCLSCGWDLDREHEKDQRIC